MRIVHFAGTLRENQDGVTRVLYRMREEAKNSSNKYSFITAALPHEAQPDMVGVKSIPFILNTDYPLAVCTPRTVSKLLANENPDLVHIHSPCTLGNAAIRYGLSRGLPVVATYHTHFPTYLRYYKMDLFAGIGWKFIRSFYSRCDAVIVPSKATLDDLEAQGMKNLIHIPHGVDTDHFSPRFRSSEWRENVGGNDKIIVGFVGRLVWEKNLMALVEAYDALRNKDKIRMVIVGDGPARKKLEILMPYAHFTGFQTREEVAVSYASMDVFVMPSVTETFGNVTVEAMASGVVAVCAAAGGALDIIDPGVTGVLVAPNDSLALAQAIDQIVEQPQMRKKLADAGLSASQQFQWKKTLERYEALYSELAQNHAARPTRLSASKFAQRLRGTFRRSS